MKHARDDYNRIQDPSNKIPADEPVFLLRAQDVVAPETILFWAYKARQVGASPQIVEAAMNQWAEMKKWQKEHPPKVPDMPSNAGGV